MTTWCPWRRWRPSSEGAAARQDAECSLAEVRSRWPHVMAVSSSLRDLRERNHFAETIEQAMRGRQ